MVDKEIKFEDYSEDVQKWIMREHECASIPCYKDDVYKNSQGLAYKVRKDSLENNIYVWVETKDKFGRAVREIPKAIMFS